MVREAFQKDLSGCRVENGLGSAKCIEVTTFVILTPEPLRHCLNPEPLAKHFPEPSDASAKEFGDTWSSPSPSGSQETCD